MRWCRGGLSPLVLALCSIACVQKDPRIAKLEQRLDAAEKKLETVEQDVSILKTRADSTDETLIQLTPDTAAEFAPDQKGFTAIHTSYGVFLVSVSDIKPYANGYKVVLNFGNPLNVDFDGAEIQVQWGPKRKQGIKYSEYLQQLRTSKQSVLKRLRGGSWNPVEVVLAPASQTDIERIVVQSITTNKVLLAAR